MADIFISYAEEDASLAVEIAQTIERRGCTAWYYERDSIPGRSYLLQTGEAINACSTVILLISSHSIVSCQVRQEVIRAYESNKPFMPLLVDISHAEFQQRQPEWRAAIGAAVSLRIPPEGVNRLIPQITKGLAALGIQAAEHHPNSPRSPAEAQRQQEAESAREHERQQYYDKEEYHNQPQHDTQSGCSPRLSARKKILWFVGGGIAVVFVVILIFFPRVRTPPPQPPTPPAAGALLPAPSPPHLPPALGSPSELLVGTWRFAGVELGRPVDIFWHLRPDGTATYIVNGVPQGVGTWQYIGAHIYERYPDGRQGEGAIQILDGDHFVVTIVDNGFPAHTGLQRLYIRQ